jgi:hypothetical protein
MIITVNNFKNSMMAKEEEVKMKKKVLLLGLLGLFSTQINAAPTSGTCTVPKGSYQKTCENCTCQNNVLKCQCKWVNMRAVFSGQKYTTLKDPHKYADIIATGNLRNTLQGISTKNGCATVKDSYKNACSNCTCTGNYLYCQKCSGEGEINPSFIYLTQDNQSIITMNGSLAYEFTPALNHSTNLPRGSYLQNCGGCSVNKNVLSCMCGESSSDIITPVKVTLDLSKISKDSFLSYKSDYKKIESSNLPPGNYMNDNINACEICHVKNNILTCPNCGVKPLDISGMLGSETVSYLQTHIANTNDSGGQLAITSQINLPPGNFNKNCGNCTVKNNILSCMCSGVVKKWGERATLDLSTVPKGATIENSSGKLTIKK